MIIIILLFILLISLSIIKGFMEDDLMLFVVYITIVSCFLFLVSFPIIGFTGGFIEYYSEGKKQGYLTKISRKGLIYKTYEGELQLGTGNMASLQEPFEFSIVNEEVLKTIQENIGNKVELEYTQWYVQPFKRGESGYEILNVKILEENKYIK